MIYVNCNSHRARQRLLSMIGKRQAYYIADLSNRLFHRGIYALSAEEFDKAQHIKGVRRLRDCSNLAKCWP
jgi:hypothetical protein